MTAKEEIIALAGECGIQNDYISEDQAVEAFYHAARRPLKEEIEHLRMAIADTEALEIGTGERCEQLRNKLAAAQAREQQYRDAFELQRKDKWHWEEIRDKALALPADTSALEAMIAKAGEVMRERCIAVSCDNPDGFVGGSIRALPGVTLADLKGAE